MTHLVHTQEQLRGLPSHGRRVLVPTMGALHRGHLDLVDRAREAAGDDGEVVVSIFVNPTQFGDASDLAKYPRTLADDVAKCEAHGVDVVWAPGVTDVYPHGDLAVTVDPGPAGAILEGVSRAGHFAGVLTVVTKLIGIVKPTAIVMGEKDFQQLCLVRRMVADLDLGVEVIGVATARDEDGLALSSRNVFLTPADRAAGLAISRAIAQAGRADARPADEVVAVARETMIGLDLDYVEVVDDRLQPFESGVGRLVIAARVGAVRLIDNGPVAVAFGGDQQPVTGSRP